MNETVKINTPKEMPKFELIEQTADFIKAKNTYENGLILITSLSAEGTMIESNFDWIKEIDGSLTPNYNSPNDEFIDSY